LRIEPFGSSGLREEYVMIDGGNQISILQPYQRQKDLNTENRVRGRKKQCISDARSAVK
jgi:hypothetical protein